MILRPIAVLAVLAACGSNTLDRSPTADANAPRPDSPAQQSDPGVQRYIGQLAQTATVPFGGAPYCSYSITLKNVSFDVTVHPTHGLTTMSAADTAVEAIVGTCPYPAAPPTLQGFAHDGGPTLADSNGAFKPTVDGLTTNQPTTTLTVVVQPMTETTLDVTARWQRTDSATLLNWVVSTSAALPLSRVPCETNGVYCLGDSAVGSLYGCTDGIHLTEIKQCSAGCPLSPPPTMPHLNQNCN